MSATIDPTLHSALRTMARLFMRTLTDDDVEAYADALEGIPPFEAARACHELGKRERFFPRPVVIRACVDELRRESLHADTSAPRVMPHACDCHQGWLPATAAGVVISWDQSRGTGDWLYRGTGHHHVVRCTRCQQLRVPHKPVTRRSYDDEHDDRRR